MTLSSSFVVNLRILFHGKFPRIYFSLKLFTVLFLGIYCFIFNKFFIFLLFWVIAYRIIVICQKFTPTALAFGTSELNMTSQRNVFFFIIISNCFSYCCAASVFVRVFILNFYRKNFTLATSVNVLLTKTERIMT